MNSIRTKLLVLLNTSMMLYTEKHKDFYNEHKYIALILICIDAVFINPFRRLRMYFQERNVDSNQLIQKKRSEAEKPVEFLLFGIGSRKDVEDKSNNGFFDYFKFSGQKYIAEALVNDKFKNDKCIIDNDRFTILIDGVIFNLKEIEDMYSLSNIYDIAVAILIRDDGDRILNNLRGEFAGILYDKRNNKIKFFVDHFSMKKMYFYHKDSKIFISTNFDVLVDILRLNNIKYGISTNSAYMLLTHGYMFEDNTLVEDIKKLEGGIVVKVHKGKLSKENYYTLDNEAKTEETYDEIIEKIDLLFKNAVKRQFDKNLEYGYKHLCTLSGGLDSRMVCIVAHELGYEDIKTVTFGQRMTWDEKIAHDISKDYNFEWDFFPLDDANHLFNISYGLKISGQTIYSESAKAANYFCDDLSGNSSYGLVHTGQAGDVVLGYFEVKSNLENRQTLLDTVASKILLHRVSDAHLKGQYKNQEELLLKQRVFNSTFYGNAGYEQGRASYSPFMDVDFFNYCMTIPIKYRKGHKVYKDWMIKKHPDAARYKWEKTNDYITKEIKNDLQDDFKPIFYSMNPHDYWFHTNTKLRLFIKGYFRTIDKLEIFETLPYLKNDLKRMFKKGTTREKLQVITVVALIDRYWH